MQMNFSYENPPSPGLTFQYLENHECYLSAIKHRAIY